MNEANVNKLMWRLQTCTHVKHDAKPLNKRSFNMYHTFFKCGSPSSIAGHCIDLMGKPDSMNPVMEYLGADYSSSFILTQGHFSKAENLMHISVEDAIKALMDLKKKGWV